MGRLAGFTISPDGLTWQENMRRWRDVRDREEAIDAMFEGPEDRASDGERMEVMGSAAFPRRNDWD